MQSTLKKPLFAIWADHRAQKQCVKKLFYLLLVLGCCWGGDALAQEPVVLLPTAEFVLTDQAGLPGNQLNWQPVTLPDWWIKRMPSTAGVGWYRLHFQMSARRQVMYAVYLPKLGLNAEVFLNGERLGDGGSFVEPLARNWNRPLLFAFPASSLRAGDNILHIRLRGHPYTQPYLFPPVVGEEAQLRLAYDRLLFSNITLNQTASLIILAVGIFMFSLWWQRRKEVAYGLFAVSAFVWSAQSANLFIRQAPLDTALWEILVNASFQVFAMLLLFSLLSFVGVRMRLFRKVLLVAMVLSPLTMLLAPAEYFFRLTAFWHFSSVLATGITIAVLVREAVFRKNSDALKLVGAMGVVIAFAAHDWLIHSHVTALRWLEPYLLGDGYLLQFAAPVLFLMIGMIMTSRFACALNDYESLNNELESRIQEKHRELELTYARMRELEREQAVQDERERIYGDLHDDVGAKLLSLVYRAGSAESADLARSALQDLRDVVSRSEVNHADMEETLLGWESESRQRLQGAKIELVWQCSGVADGVLDQQQILNIGRILRESLSNVIHHAKATQVQVDLHIEPARFRLCIQDNGVGISHERSGRGLKNIRKRAETVGATLHFFPVEPQGTGLELQVTLAQELTLVV